MKKLRLRTWTVSGLVLAGVLAVAGLFVLSQAYAQFPPGQQGPPGGPGGPPGAGGFAPPMPLMPSAAICAAGDFIYVVRGNTLFQFEAQELRLVKKVLLEEEPPLPPRGGFRDGPPPPPRDR